MGNDIADVSMPDGIEVDDAAAYFGVFCYGYILVTSVILKTSHTKSDFPIVTFAHSPSGLDS